MLYPHWSRLSSINTYSDTNSAWRDAHKLRHIVDYIDAHLAGCYLHQFPHSSWIQSLRRPHFRHHTYNLRAYSLAHSSSRPNDTNRVPDHDPPRLHLHCTRWQAHADRVRHTPRLYRDQHHQPPRRKQHNHKHRDHDLLRNRLDMQRHAPRPRLSAARNDNLRYELHHQDATDDLYRL